MKSIFMYLHIEREVISYIRHLCFVWRIEASTGDKRQMEDRRIQAAKQSRSWMKIMSPSCSSLIIQSEEPSQCMPQLCLELIYWLYFQPLWSFLHGEFTYWFGEVYNKQKEDWSNHICTGVRKHHFFKSKSEVDKICMTYFKSLNEDYVRDLPKVWIIQGGSIHRKRFWQSQNC